MPDLRTRREKLEAMAHQTVSPNEAAIAQRLLSELESTRGDDNLAAASRADDWLSTVKWETYGFRITVDADDPNPGKVFAAAYQEWRRRNPRPKRIDAGDVRTSG